MVAVVRRMSERESCFIMVYGLFWIGPKRRPYRQLRSDLQTLGRCFRTIWSEAPSPGRARAASERGDPSAGTAGGCRPWADLIPGHLANRSAPACVKCRSKQSRVHRAADYRWLRIDSVHSQSMPENNAHHSFRCRTSIAQRSTSPSQRDHAPDQKPRCIDCKVKKVRARNDGGLLRVVDRQSPRSLPIQLASGASPFGLALYLIMRPSCRPTIKRACFNHCRCCEMPD